VNASLSRARALILVGAGAVALGPSMARAQTPPIRIGTLGSGDTYALAFYAQEGGFFTKAGLNVEIVPVGEPSSIIASVAGGSLEAGFADPPLIGNANNRGLPVAYFAGGGLYSSDAPTTVLVVAPSSPYKTPKDFHGKTIAVVVAKSIGAAALTSWITQGGGDPDQIKLIELPFTVMVTAVAKGDIAAAFLAEPYLTNAKNDVKIVAKPFDAIGPRFLINSCFASRSWIAANGVAAAKLASAFTQTANWVNGHHDESAPTLAKFGKVPLEVVKSMTRVRFAELDPKLIQPVLDTASKFKLIEKPVSANEIVMKAPPV
jgi:ABC-type nitrate/sulfonate/bicarbonate transport system substrate-binding protein